MSSRFRLQARPAFFLLLLLFSWSGMVPVLQAGERPLIFVSVVPQQYFVERIAGGLVDVQAMVKPGFSPHTYEPTPRQISQLARADLYIRIGVPFEDSWMPRIRGVNPDMPVLDARTGLKLLPVMANAAEAAEPDDRAEGGQSRQTRFNRIDGHDHQHGNQPDPHVWTSP
ncbi:MAG: zinc ABC transporter substrate-binding protein, partial [Thiothrix sp.]|nr:zinc ABC transporter substrate-binding protein [Thiothrix sp.]